jgi:hypothetical protein
MSPQRTTTAPSRRCEENGNSIKSSGGSGTYIETTVRVGNFANGTYFINISARRKALNQPNDAPGCGVLDHHYECLCDVHVATASAIGIECLTDLPYVAGVIQRLDVGVPWTARDFESVMRIVMQAHDMQNDRKTSAPWITDKVDEDRAAILDAHAAGKTIVQVMTELDLTFDEWRNCFLPGAHNPLHRLTLHQWEDLEQAARSARHSYIALAHRVDVPYATVRDALIWLGLKEHMVEQRRRTNGPRHLSSVEREQMLDWIREGHSPTAIKKMLWDAFEVTIHRSLVSKTRLRMTQKGEL